MQHSQSRPKITTVVLLSLYNDLIEHQDIFESGLELFGVELGELKDSHAHISLHRYVGLLEWLAEALHDPWLGLRASQRAGPDAIGAVGYLFLSSDNLETALRGLSRYLETIQSSSRIESRTEGDLVRIRYRITDESVCPRIQDSEYSIGLMWRLMRMLSRYTCNLKQVTFEHDKPSSNSTLPRRVFGAPVLYGESANEMTLSFDDYHRTHNSLLDPHLFQILDDHIATTLEIDDIPITFSETVSRLITDVVLADGARANVVAELLSISTATLHRRIRAEGFRFKELVDLQTQKVAVRLLTHTSLPIATISRRLGFANPGSFNRAFGRWLNATPRAYRNEAKGQFAIDFKSRLLKTRESTKSLLKRS